MWLQINLLGLFSSLLVSSGTPSELSTAQKEPPRVTHTIDASAPPRLVAQADQSQTKVASRAQQRNLEETISLMQQQYENTSSFSTNFTQRYTYTMLRKTQVSKGQAVYLKPGQIKWTYTSPTKKSFIVNKGKLWVNQPEENLVMVDNCFKEDSLTASLSFLWGSADLKEQFRIEWFEGVFGDKEDLHLLLFPLKPQNMFSKLILVLDQNSYRVKQSIVVDPQGNINQFIYEDTKYNLKLGARDFDFKPPPSSVVSRMPGSCTAK